VPASNRWGVGGALHGRGLDHFAGGDEVFRQLVLARIIEPTRKQDSLRVLAETGIAAVSYATLKRHLPTYAEDGNNSTPSGQAGNGRDRQPIERPRVHTL